MASVSEIAGMINETAVSVSTAAASLHENKETVQQAKRSLFEAMGDISPHRLMDYMASLNEAERTIDEAINALNSGLESGQAYIAQLYS